MEEEADEGNPVWDNQYPGKDHKSFQGVDNSIEKRTSPFYTFQ
jgi:hypothetical protein